METGGKKAKVSKLITGLKIMTVLVQKIMLQSSKATY